MNKALLAALIICGLLASLVAGLQAVEITMANPFPTYPIISIESPTNKTYTTNTLPLNVTLITKWDGLYFTSENRQVSYCIDDKESILITQTEYKYDSEKQSSTLYGLAVLTNLTEGAHNIKINAVYRYDDGKQIFASNSSINFTIDANYSPSPSPNPTTIPTAIPSTLPTSSPTPTIITQSPSSEPTLSPSPSATVPEFPTWIILPLAIVMTLMAAIIVRRRTA